MHITVRIREEGMHMSQRVFGVTREGKEITEYTLTNRNGMELYVIDLGATITAIRTRGIDREQYDVVLGYDNPVDYQTHTCYFGAVIGRNSNRINQARIQLDGKEYQLEANDHENNLHSGKNGFHAVIWNMEKLETQSITFSYVSADGEQDFPGNMTAKVTYTLTDENEVAICYEAVSDKATVANFTNDSYFNLDGNASGSKEDNRHEHIASFYTPADAPTQVPARPRAAHAGICMDAYTVCVGIQFYAGNFIGKQQGKDGACYDSRHGFCLETQYFPNAVNEKNFKSPVIKPGETYHSETKYCFSIER